jgi:hypothetical protein
LTLRGVSITQPELPQTDINPQVTWVPETEAERKAIREQLDRILNSPLFKNSKRYPNLLRYVVERALEGHKEHLKERTLGIEVFGRQPDYDTNLDPVVRTTAVEIRKRIAQYYHDPGHESEIRIDFPPGTYLPEFRMPQKLAVETPAPEVRKFPAQRLAWMAGAAIVALSVFVWYWLNAPSALDRFWAPVLESPEPVLLGIGGYPTEGPSPVVTLMDLQRSERVAFSDSMALANLTALLVEKKKPYHIRFQANGRLDELKDGPSILIGAFNNTWTLRLTSSLRFGFKRDPVTNISRIEDRQHPEVTKYSHKMDVPYGEVTEDYAVISRVLDPTTGKIVVTASGLAKFGTAAAGDFLTNPVYMEELQKRGPADWDRKNMQILIATHVVGYSSGPPRILETHFW